MQTITSVSEAVRTLDSLERNFFDNAGWIPHPFPFGIWFRGHPKTGLELQPGAFRKYLPSPRDAKSGCWDETNVYDHLKLLVPSYEQTYHSAFDWLCLMQHYRVPTRLLDWSESILSALYFAVKGEPECDSELIVLNAMRLNRISRGRPTISTPDTDHVVIRAEMATTRSFNKLVRRDSIQETLTQLTNEFGPNWLEKCCLPIAVYPKRLNERMVFQTSVFTLHGGKMYNPEMRKYYPEDDRIPPPITLHKIQDKNPRKPILRQFLIPRKARPKILDELFRVGVHEAMLFPEIDHQADYLERLWWYREKESLISRLLKAAFRRA